MMFYVVYVLKVAYTMNKFNVLGVIQDQLPIYLVLEGKK